MGRGQKNVRGATGEWVRTNMLFAWVLGNIWIGPLTHVAVVVLDS